MLKRSLLALIPVIACAAPVFADPVTITGGSVFVGSPLSGEDPPFGFSLTGGSTAINAETFAQGLTGFNSGQIVNLSTTVSSSFVNHPIPQTVDGVTYSAWLSGQMTFTAIPFDASASSLTTPFTMMAALSGFDNAERTGTPLFTVNLTGAGTASILGARDIGGGSFIVQSGTLFDFSPSPTPEPSTMLLVGVGLVGFVGRRFWNSAGS